MLIPETTVLIPKSDRADSEIRPCRFRNQTVRFRNQTVHFRNQTVCFRNQTVCFEIRPCVSESDRAFSRKSDRVFPETHRCDFFSRRGVFLESDRAFSGIRPCRFRNQTVLFPETTVCVSESYRVIRGLDHTCTTVGDSERHQWWTDNVAPCASRIVPSVGNVHIITLKPRTTLSKL